MLEINRACIYACTFDNCNFYIRNICIYFIIYIGQFVILKLWKVFGKLMKKMVYEWFFVEEAFERWIVELCHHKRLIWMLSPYNIFLVKEEKVYSVLKFKGDLISMEALNCRYCNLLHFFNLAMPKKLEKIAFGCTLPD